jgi:hypothetical protein
MRRAVFVVVALAVVLALGAAQASATSCSPVNKPLGAGSAGTATVDVTNGQFTPVDLNLNPAGKPRGGFISVTPVVNGNPVGPTADVFNKDLPDGAHNSGPGDSECDGVGIDDLAEC